jgi:hypothetical protein
MGWDIFWATFSQTRLVPLICSSKETINRLIPVGVECFLTQLLETGYFHADPHPGNLLVRAMAPWVVLQNKFSSLQKN